MDFFLENLWIWLVIAFAVVGCGYIAFTNKRDFRILAGSAGAALLVLLLGVALVRFVPTDRKAITRSLDGAIAAVLEDDQERVFTFIAPRAEPVRAMARHYMPMFRIEQATYSDLRIEINDFTSPPTAETRFYAVARGKFKSDFLTGPYDRARVRLFVEFEKTSQGWLISACRYEAALKP